MLKTLFASAAAIVLTASLATAADLTGKTWDEIVAQAKEEGQMTWFVWYLTDDLRRFVQPFEKEYGIKVTIPEGTASGNSDKLLAEKGRETGDIDAFAWGFTDFDQIDNASMFHKLDILPEDAGRVGQLAGSDGEGYVLAYWGNQTGIAYDPAHVDEANLPQSPEDFAAFWQANPEKFGFNYENGGAGPSFAENIMRVVAKVDSSTTEASPEWIASLQPAVDFLNEYAEDYIITTGNADSITRISDGEIWMAPAWEDHLAGLQKRGEARKEIKLYVPEMGMNGGGNGVAIPLNAAHPAAAAVFINWLTSAEVQTAFNEQFGTAPMNAAADDSNALVPNDQRQFSVPGLSKPQRDAMKTVLIDDVILER
ncbi:extracellular solute-binding protein [Paracoccus sp. (in: a-proteobacteria)]|uniref:extracellular solute-binding protein n=1 Tax=Paracoccus sp. TaxID=267 RepID=UPI003A872FA6